MLQTLGADADYTLASSLVRDLTCLGSPNPIVHIALMPTNLSSRAHKQLTLALLLGCSELCSIT